MPDDDLHVPVHCGVVSAEVLHDEVCVNVVVKQVGKESRRFFHVDVGLASLVMVWFSDPSKL